MTKSSLLPALLFCFCLFNCVLQAQASQDSSGDPVAKLQRAGWTLVQEGVLQRQVRPGEIETLVFGAEGFTWKLRELRGQLAVLRRNFQANPAPDLRRAIAGHRKVIASTLEIIERARTAGPAGEPIFPKDDCVFSFISQPYAAPKADRQGIRAEANVQFNAPPPCDLTGEVYAYTFAETTVNGGATSLTGVDDPRIGAAVSASAAVDRNGGPPCRSNAYASLTINGPNPVSYNRSMDNENCPVPSPFITVTSNQPFSIVLAESECVRITWTVNIPSSFPGYTARIYRNNVLVAAGPSYSQQICNDGGQSGGVLDLPMRFEVLDGAGHSQSIYRTWRVYFL